MTARVILLAAMVALLGGCASQTAFRKAEESANRGDWDAAVLGYHRALGLDPGNDRYRAAMVRAHLKASAVHFERGKRYAEAGSLELAIAEFEQTVFLDPENQYAKVELDKVRARLDRLRMTPSEIELAKAAAAKKSLAPPKLSPSSNQPIVLKFKDQEEQKIYDAISKISGINFLYDDKLDQDLKTKKSVDLSGVTFERAMDILMLQFKHFYKVIDESTLYIAQDNRAKRTELEDKVIKTFYLSNGDTKQVNTLLRSLLEVRKIAENAQLNSISIKDSPDVVEVAQKIIEANDKAKAELVVDVELLELDRTRLQELGIDLKDKSLTLSFLGGNAVGRAEQPQLHQAERKLVDRPDPDRRRQLPQERLRHQGPEPAADPRDRGREGRGASRQPGPDPDHDLQHEQHRGQQHRARDLVHVPEHRHPAHARAARSPQPRGDAEAERRGLVRGRLRRRVGRNGRPADHRHPAGPDGRAAARR